MNISLSNLFFILIPILSAPLVLIFFLFTKAFKKENKRTAHTLAFIFSFWIYFYEIIKSFLFTDSFIFSFLFFSTPSFGTFFVVGGIISTIYFSKYYGEIIIKAGIAIFTIQASYQILGIITDFDSSLLLFEVFLNILIISFWILYFKILSLKTNNVSFVPKNDPKYW